MSEGRVHRRLLRSRFLGFLTYALAACVLTAVVMCLVLGVLGFVVSLQRMPAVAFLCGYVVLLIPVGFLCLREFARRASARLEFQADGLEWISGKRTAIAYDGLEYEIHDITVDHAGLMHKTMNQLLLRAPKIGTLRLNPDEWPTEQIKNDLQEIAIPRIADALRERMNRFEEVEFLEPRPSRMRMAFQLAFASAWAALVVVWRMQGPNSEPRVHGFHLLIFGLFAVPACFGFLLDRRRRGVVLSRDGLRPALRSRLPVIPWAEVIELKALAIGLRITISGRSQPITVSSTCANLGALVLLLRERMPGFARSARKSSGHDEIEVEE